MTEKQRRRCVEPKQSIERYYRSERGYGINKYEYGILRYCLMIHLSDKGPPLFTELPFDIHPSTILRGCLQVLRRYGVDPPDLATAVDAMRVAFRTRPPSVKDADLMKFLEAIREVWGAKAVFGSLPEEAKVNLAHPARLAIEIVMRTAELLAFVNEPEYPRDWLVSTAVGVGVAYGQLEMALDHERDALIGKRVRAGNRRDLAERARERRKLWEAKLGTAEWKGSKPRHGEVERIAREIADALGSRPEAERRWYERNMRQRRSG
jgi:hypothetical protein